MEAFNNMIIICSSIIVLCFFYINICDVFRTNPVNYICTTSAELKKYLDTIQLESFEGVKVIYNWKDLEKEKGVYDFSKIEKDYVCLSTLKKKLFIQIKERSFDSKNDTLPSYIMEEEIYEGGALVQYNEHCQMDLIACGWVTKQWNPAVHNRFHLLLNALAREFDGRIFGISFPEVSISIDSNDNYNDFSCEKYCKSVISNLKFSRVVFNQSHVVQYVNSFACEAIKDQLFFYRLLIVAYKYKIGLGIPYILFYENRLVKKTDSVVNKYKKKLPLLVMSVQESIITDINPKTNKPYTREEFIDFTKNDLRVDIIFWSPDSPWIGKL